VELPACTDRRSTGARAKQLLDERFHCGLDPQLEKLGTLGRRLNRFSRTKTDVVADLRYPGTTDKSFDRVLLGMDLDDIAE
jgi:hypothetical protein